MKLFLKSLLGFSYILNASGFIAAWYVPGEPLIWQTMVALFPGLLFLFFYE